MPNKNGNAYGLTTLCPIIEGSEHDRSYADHIRDQLQQLPLNADSPMAKVPNTYLCRFFVLEDVFYQGKPAVYEHLKSKYLVFSSNFYGDPGAPLGGRDAYLRGMWQTASPTIKDIWQHCVGFHHVQDETSFVEYIGKCQVETTFYFNGSTDDTLAEQLKALYLKQEFSKFVHEHQGDNAVTLQAAFEAFVDRTKPDSLEGPTWTPGAATHQ